MTWHPDMPLEYRNQIVTGDARELAKAIPDESVDLIFTDPPYLKEYLPLYGWLSETASRVLRPNGFCLAMCGGSWLDKVMVLMGQNLDYFWAFLVDLSGQYSGSVFPQGRQMPVVTRSKMVLAYSKGLRATPRCQMVDRFTGAKEDKRYHVWGQDEASARYYLDCMTTAGSVVFDPFCGGGTTLTVCLSLRMDYVSFEIDAATADIARQRVAQTQVPWFVALPEQLALTEDG